MGLANPCPSCQTITAAGVAGIDAGRCVINPIRYFVSIVHFARVHQLLGQFSAWHAALRIRIFPCTPICRLPRASHHVGHEEHVGVGASCAQDAAWPPRDCPATTASRRPACHRRRASAHGPPRRPMPKSPPYAATPPVFGSAAGVKWRRTASACICGIAEARQHLIEMFVLGVGGE